MTMQKHNHGSPSTNAISSSARRAILLSALDQLAVESSSSDRQRRYAQASKSLRDEGIFPRIRESCGRVISMEPLIPVDTTADIQSVCPIRTTKLLLRCLTWVA